MSPATHIPTAPTAAPPPTRPLPSAERFVLPHCSWAGYEAMLREVGDDRVRLTYDHGVLELRLPSAPHEQFAELLAMLVRVLAEELSMPFRSGGSTTFRSEPRQRGLEPDRCFWFRAGGLMESPAPPPDLAVEIDITSSLLDRMGIYADLGVREIWRFDGESLTFHALCDAGYALVERSARFPELAPADLLPFVARYREADELTVIREFRAFVRRRLAGQP